MDCVCQRYHKECSTRTNGRTYDLSLDFFQQLYIYIHIYIHIRICTSICIYIYIYTRFTTKHDELRNDLRVVNSGFLQLLLLLLLLLLLFLLLLLTPLWTVGRRLLSGRKLVKLEPQHLKSRRDRRDKLVTDRPRSFEIHRVRQYMVYSMVWRAW